MRSFDERSHSYLGYVLRVEGAVDGEADVFQIALGKAAQAKHRFQAGMAASGLAVPDPRLETAGFCKTSGLKILKDVKGAGAKKYVLHGRGLGRRGCHRPPGTG
jgi:hypothetical protein